MSVCTGAFKFGARRLVRRQVRDDASRLLRRLREQFPKVKLVRGPRFVDEGRVVSAGGLTSGIDLALHVVERFHGRQIADNVAGYMEFARTARPAGERRA